MVLFALYIKDNFDVKSNNHGLSITVLDNELEKSKHDP